jgi:SPP1 family predicted phage head-tail adaptor
VEADGLMAYQRLEVGRLDRRVTIQALTETSDGTGGQDRAWSDIATVYASIEPGSGREFMAAQQVQPELSHIVRIHFRTGLTSKHKLKYAPNGVARSFSIHAVIDPHEENEQLVLLCAEVAPV